MDKVYCALPHCDSTETKEGALGYGWRGGVVTQVRPGASVQYYCPKHPFGEPPYERRLVALAGPDGHSKTGLQTIHSESISLEDWLEERAEPELLDSEDLGDKPGSLYLIELRDSAERLIDSYLTESRNLRTPGEEPGR